LHALFFSTLALLYLFFLFVFWLFRFCTNIIDSLIRLCWLLLKKEKRKKVYWETGAFNSAKKNKNKRKVRVGNNGKANSS
jgi:hypothetical protein